MTGVSSYVLDGRDVQSGRVFVASLRSVCGQRPSGCEQAMTPPFNAREFHVGDRLPIGLTVVSQIILSSRNVRRVVFTVSAHRDSVMRSADAIAWIDAVRC